MAEEILQKIRTKVRDSERRVLGNLNNFTHRQEVQDIRQIRNEMLTAHGFPIRTPEGKTDYSALNPKQILDWLGNSYISSFDRQQAFETLQQKMQNPATQDKPNESDFAKIWKKWIENGADYFCILDNRQQARTVLTMLKSLQPARDTSKPLPPEIESTLASYESYWRKRVNSPFLMEETRQNAKDALDFLAEQRGIRISTQETNLNTPQTIQLSPIERDIERMRKSFEDDGQRVQREMQRMLERHKDKPYYYDLARFVSGEEEDYRRNTRKMVDEIIPEALSANRIETQREEQPAKKGFLRRVLGKIGSIIKAPFKWLYREVNSPEFRKMLWLD